MYSEFSPIDLTAEGIVRIAQYAGKQTVFHLNSNRPIYFDRFVKSKSISFHSKPTFFRNHTVKSFSIWMLLS